MATGYVWHELYGWHDTGTAAGALPPHPALGIQPLRHFESPESKKRLHELLAVTGLADHLMRLPVEPATEEQLLRVHTPGHLGRIRSGSDHPRGGDGGDGLTPFGPGGYDIARLAAGGAIAAVRAVAGGRVANAYALVRPPGHHALADTGMGFCLFANVAVAVRDAMAAGAVERVAVVDWDVHHGNGTQAIFLDDPDVLALSIHQDRFFPPDSGHLHERGTGAAEHATLNVPLPPGSGNGAYLRVMEEVVVPALRRFRPDLIVVACGFDANALDPLGRMLVTSGGYRAMTEIITAAAEELCGGRLVAVHEGGYSEAYVPFCGLAVVEALSGVKTGFSDPLEPLVAGMGGQDLQPHQAAVIAAAAALPVATPG